MIGACLSSEVRNDAAGNIASLLDWTGDPRPDNAERLGGQFSGWLSTAQPCKLTRFTRRNIDATLVAFRARGSGTLRPAERSDGAAGRWRSVHTVDARGGTAAAGRSETADAVPAEQADRVVEQLSRRSGQVWLGGAGRAAVLHQ